VEVKPGEAVTSVIVAWTVERFVTLLPKGKTKAVKEDAPSSSKGKEVKSKKAGKTEKLVKKTAMKKSAKKKK
jgi:hypothetical protein